MSSGDAFVKSTQESDQAPQDGRRPVNDVVKLTILVVRLQTREFSGERFSLVDLLHPT